MQPKTLFITYNGVIRNSYYLSSTLFIFFFLLQQALPARQAHNQGLLLCASMGYCKRQLSVSSYRHPMHTKWAAFQCWMSLHARHRSSVSCLLVRSGELSTLAQGTAVPAMLGWRRRECLNNIPSFLTSYPRPAAPCLALPPRNGREHCLIDIWRIQRIYAGINMYQRNLLQVGSVG